MRSGFESRAADWLGVDEALARILGGAAALPAERQPLLECLGRALAEEIVADATLPPWDNSAMDGFAVRRKDVAGATPEHPIRLEVIARVRAGERPDVGLAEGQAMRIMTGAPVPLGADTVVRVEDTDAEREERGFVLVRNDRDAGENVRPAGQDMRAGERLLGRGHRVTPGTVGVLAASGRVDAMVHRRPTVGVLATGDEIRAAGSFEEVRRGRGVPDSNGPMLAAMIAASGAVPLALGIARDDPADLSERIEGASEADVLITIGGASMGEADLVKRVLDQLGYQTGFWRVRMRPGSPVGFGWLVRGDRHQPVLSLPGNPTSAFVTFEVLARPLLLRLGGHERTSRRAVVATADEPIRAPARLTYFLRVALTEAGGRLHARLTGPQGSGLVSGLARAGGLAVVPEGASGVEEGDPVTVLLLDDV